MKIDSILKKTTFGGFSKESVFELVEKLQEENIQLSKKIEANEQEVEKFESVVAEKDYEIKELNQKNSALLEDNATNSLKIEEMDANREEYENNLAELKNKIADIEEKFAALQEKYDKYGAADEYEKKAKKQADAVLESVRNVLSGAIERISASNNELRNSNVRFSEVSEKVVADADALIRSISDISNELTAEEAE